VRGALSRGYDLAIACALVPVDRLRGLVLFGELTLDGQLRPVRGVLPRRLPRRL